MVEWSKALVRVKDGLGFDAWLVSFMRLSVVKIKNQHETVYCRKFELLLSSFGKVRGVSDFLLRESEYEQDG